MVLAAALLAAWQGALVHPLEHLDQHGGYVHLAAEHGHDDGDGGPTALCDAIAAVAACVDGRIHVELPASAAADIAAAGIVAFLRGASPPAYRSQAPPQVS